MPLKCLLPGLILAFCAASPLVSVAAERSASPEDNQASVTLLQSASQQLQAGQVDQAATTLERALRIEPNNPTTLHYLGQVRFQQGQYQQAEALAARSNMQAGRNAELRRRNDQLIQTAQQARASSNPVGATEDLMAVQKGLEEEVLRRREAGIAAVEEDSPEIEPRAVSSAPSRAEWVEESQTVGSPVPGGRFETTSFEPEPMFDELDIPRGHRPPPGKCRIWFPDRPAGHQPPPGSCHKLQYRVPSGAYLVRG